MRLNLLDQPEFSKIPTNPKYSFLRDLKELNVDMSDRRLRSLGMLNISSISQLLSKRQRVGLETCILRSLNLGKSIIKYLYELQLIKVVNNKHVAILPFEISKSTLSKYSKYIDDNGYLLDPNLTTGAFFKYSNNQVVSPKFQSISSLLVGSGLPDIDVFDPASNLLMVGYPSFIPKKQPQFFGLSFALEGLRDISPKGVFRSGASISRQILKRKETIKREDTSKRGRSYSRKPTGVRIKKSFKSFVERQTSMDMKHHISASPDKKTAGKVLEKPIIRVSAAGNSPHFRPVFAKGQTLNLSSNLREENERLFRISTGNKQLKKGAISLVQGILDDG